MDSSRRGDCLPVPPPLGNIKMGGKGGPAKAGSGGCLFEFRTPIRVSVWIARARLLTKLLGPIGPYCAVPKVFPQDVVKYMQTPFGSGAPVQGFYQRAALSHALAREDSRVAKPILGFKEF